MRHTNGINKIVLNIPHASTCGIRENGWGDDVLPYVQKWTDWRTDELFASQNPKVAACVFGLSRFVVDVERLINDPMEKIGQGIIYSRFEDAVRGDCDNAKLMGFYYQHIRNIQSQLTDGAMLIDCHSYPTELASDVDVCIGFNEDWSKPCDEILDLAKRHFEELDYNVAFNHPYSNSLTPEMPFAYPSMMIELNKATYQTESDFTKMQMAISDLYDKIFTTMNSEKRTITPAEINAFRSDFTTALRIEAENNPDMTEEKIDLMLKDLTDEVIIVQIEAERNGNDYAEECLFWEFY